VCYIRLRISNKKVVYYTAVEINLQGFIAEATHPVKYVQYKHNHVSLLKCGMPLLKSLFFTNYKIKFVLFYRLKCLQVLKEVYEFLRVWN
jgi:hypothetical protein